MGAKTLLINFKPHLIVMRITELLESRRMVWSVFQLYHAVDSLMPPVRWSLVILERVATVSLLMGSDPTYGNTWILRLPRYLRLLDKRFEPKARIDITAKSNYRELRKHRTTQFTTYIKVLRVLPKNVLNILLYCQTRVDSPSRGGGG